MIRRVCAALATSALLLATPGCLDNANTPPGKSTSDPPSLSYTTASPLIDGHKTYTVASASNLRWSDLTFLINDVSWTHDPKCDRRPPPGTYQACTNETPAAGSDPLRQGDTFSLGGIKEGDAFEILGSGGMRTTIR